MDTTASSKYKKIITSLIARAGILSARFCYRLLKFEGGVHMERLADPSLVNLESILFRAIEINDLDLVGRILSEDPDLINVVRKSDEFTPLNYAALHNKPQVFNFLIEKGANINYRHPCGLSAYGISVVARD